MRLNEVLEVRKAAQGRVVQCNLCAHTLCKADEDWKRRSATAERPLRQAGPLFPAHSPFVLREFYCPGCGTLLETEVVLKGEEPISDTVRVSSHER